MPPPGSYREIINTTTERKRKRKAGDGRWRKRLKNAVGLKRTEATTDS